MQEEKRKSRGEKMLNNFLDTGAEEAINLGNDVIRVVFQEFRE